MNWKLVYSLFISSVISYSAFSQKKQVKFYSINQFGILGGEGKLGTSYQTINGIGFLRGYTGVGIGIDDYHYKTLPLFLDTRKFFGKENKGFIYVDLGYNFPWKNIPGKEVFNYDSYHFKGGIYTDMGIGAKMKFIGRSSVLISLGYNYKKLHAKIGQTSCPFVGPCFIDYSQYDFSYGRIILKTGIQF